MIANWTFDGTGRELTIHATVKKLTGGSCTVLWIVSNARGETTEAPLICRQ